MKNISRSLAVIAGVAAIAIGGTYALFFDTEIAENNTVTAGTIDIAIDGQNPWTGSYSIPDIKPGETKYIEFNVKNVGQNPVNLSKKISNWQESTGIVSEPECTEQSGAWDNANNTCDFNSHTDENDIQTQIIYDLSVEVYEVGATTPIWWQTIYADSENQTLASVYGPVTPGAYNSVKLGMLPVGATMKVKQSYHLNINTGNAYQGDQLTFDMEIRGDQLTQNESGQASVTLEDKTGDPDWNIIQGGKQGTLTYKTASSKFEYNFTASGLTNGGQYQLIYYPDPWASPKTVTLIGSAMTADGSGNISSLNQSVELNTDLPVSTDANHPAGAKIWLVPTSSLSGNTLSWTNTGEFLFDTAFITYDDTDTP